MRGEEHEHFDPPLKVAACGKVEEQVIAAIATTTLKIRANERLAWREAERKAVCS